ncbi:hypothetical protein FRC04_001033 [Tulasnella sp. 424]|nr:hypothetical protein FRC04_001033 [Tulasnella sp. 424]
MLARRIIPSALLLAGSALANPVQPVTEVVATSYPVFTSVIPATHPLSVTEGVPTATTYAEVFTSTMAAVSTSLGCVCSVPFVAYAVESQAPISSESDPITVAAASSAVFTSSPSSPVFTSQSPTFISPAIASTATFCPCQQVTTSQVVSQTTTQSFVAPTTQSAGAETQGVDQNQVLNANGAVMEIVSIQLAAVFTFIGLVGAGVTLL